MATRYIDVLICGWTFGGVTGLAFTSKAATDISGSKCKSSKHNDSKRKPRRELVTFNLTTIS